jgi:dihydropteroate synthase
MRKIYLWKLRDLEMQLGERTLIMGVLNVTPDSFSDGGRFSDPDRAYARALELEEQGADIIDIGAESTKPGSHRISIDEEWQRLVPVLKRLRGSLRAPLSLDTYKSEIAERALEYGVHIFNDPTGLTFDPNLAKVAANANAGLILNHMRGQPETWAKLPPMKDVIGTIGRELEATVSRARHAGVDRGRIVVDPGLGFGKRKEQNAEILAHLSELAALDYPLLVGPSRKSFLAQPSENQTVFATAAAVTAAVLKGAHIVRVHDVAEMQAVVQVAEEIARAAVLNVVDVDERAARPRRSPTPVIEQDRPRPPRPPISKPPAPPAEGRPVVPPQRAENPTYKREDRPNKRDGFAPPQRREFRPAAGKRPFERDKPFDREKDRRPEGPAYSKSGFSRPDFTRPNRDRPGSGAPPRRDFRPEGPPRSGPRKPKSGEDRFKPSGPKRSFDRGGDKRQGGPPRGAGPSGPGGKPPKRPFRKRP